MYADFLTCGLCAREFPLSKIIDFIGHKTSCLQVTGGHSQSAGNNGAVPPPEPALSCFFCQQDFHTARGILHHIQYNHQLDIVQQKTPFHPSCVILDHSQQVTTLALDDALNSCSADNRPGTGVAAAAAAATTISDTHTTTMVSSHTPDSVSASSSKGAAVPATCARLASAEGTTICCTGTECQVTINPPQPSPPPKKCCSSVVPKKRTRHMQEHDPEDMEQCALETLTNLRDRLLMNQKGRPGHKKARKSKLLRNRKSQCVVSCDRESVRRDAKASEESEAEAKEAERCHPCEEGEEEDSDTECVGPSCSRRRHARRSKVEIYSIEKDSIASRKTVIMNSGMTVTVQPTETAASARAPDDPATPPHAPPIPSDDASRESAQILADLMYHHHSLALEQSMTMPLQGMQTTAADSSLLPLTTLADHALQSCFSPSSVVVSDLLPADGSGNVISSVSTLGSRCPMFANASSLPVSMEMGMNVGCPVLGHLGAGSQSLDVQPLPDLDALTASIQAFPGLDHMGQHGAGLSTPEAVGSATITGLGAGEGGLHHVADDGEGGRMVGLKKRRYPTSRPYKCSQCELAFNQPIHLKKHMSKHTGVKPFKCDSCEYSTVERSHLKAHNRIHTGEKPFQCEFCSYATAQNSTLKVHLKRHHQGRQLTTAAATASTADAAKQA